MPANTWPFPAACIHARLSPQMRFGQGKRGPCQHQASICSHVTRATYSCPSTRAHSDLTSTATIASKAPQVRRRDETASTDYGPGAERTFFSPLSASSPLLFLSFLDFFFSGSASAPAGSKPAELGLAELPIINCTQPMGCTWAAAGSVCNVRRSVSIMDPLFRAVRLTQNSVRHSHKPSAAWPMGLTSYAIPGWRRSCHSHKRSKSPPSLPKPSSSTSTHRLTNHNMRLLQPVIYSR